MPLDYHAPTEQWLARLTEAGWFPIRPRDYHFTLWIDPLDEGTAQPLGEAISIQCRRDGGEMPDET